MQHMMPERMETHVPGIVSKLNPLLHEESNDNVGSTMDVLRKLGPVAHELIERLTKLMQNDDFASAVLRF